MVQQLLEKYSCKSCCKNFLTFTSIQAQCTLTYAALEQKVDIENEEKLMEVVKNVNINLEQLKEEIARSRKKT